jgi:dipeptidyl aminopeptidase/acylaminoacyl peptidase
MAIAVLNYVLQAYAGQVDPSKVAIVGHSFGAYTAVKTAFFDPRFKTCVVMGVIFDQ